ncbi:MAG TPA: hypothetical protein VLX91_06100 [Candidatus Acidoferrales bacterium]|nr:hypothetical protein [Candidatus Acidoferrales bacterium]
MEKLAIKIPTLIFFLAVIYFVSNGSDAIDSIVRSFLIAFGTALIILILTMMLVFFLTIREGRHENIKTLGVKDTGKKVEMQA